MVQLPILFLCCSRGADRRAALSWAVVDGAASGAPIAAGAGLPGLAAALVAGVVAVAARRVAALRASVAARLAAAAAAALLAADPIEVGDAAEATEAAADFFSAPPGFAAPSAEQWRVVVAVRRGRSVLCRAVAGAGKTTTLLLAAANSGAAYHLLTYNKRLQLEVARRAPPNVTPRTYHAAAGAAYETLIRTDEQLRRQLGAAPPAAPRFVVLAVDEAQDQSPELCLLVRHFLAANPEAPILVVGDELQAIYEYRGAHPGFLTEATELYEAGTPAVPALPAPPPRRWESCRLSTSYRLTPATAAFVNRHLYRAPVIVGGNTRSPNRRPVYIAAGGGLAGLVRALAAAVAAAVAEFGPEGVFVLAPSVRGLTSKRSPVAELVRRHLAGVPTYVAGGDEERVDEELIRGKLAVLSYCSVKGCERPCVILAGFDETYFQYYERGWDEDEDRRASGRLPNVLTVAATRASELLVVVAAARATLRTVDVARLAADCELRGAPAPARALPRPRYRERRTTVTDLLRHLHPETVRAAAALVTVAAAPDARPRPPAPPARAHFGGLVEDVRFVYGVLAPALAEVARTGASAFGAGADSPEVVASAADLVPYRNQITLEEYDAYPPMFWESVTSAGLTEPADRTPVEWATLAVAVHAVRDGRHHVARQVADYGWVDAGALAALRDAALAAIAGRGGRFEVALPPAAVATAAGPVEVYGRADFVEDSGVVWEFKLGELDVAHELQLAAYLALRGGGEGVLTSLLYCDTRRVFLRAADAPALLRTLAAGAAPAAGTAAELVAALAARLAGDPGADLGDAAPAEDLPDDVAALTLEDVYA